MQETVWVEILNLLDNGIIYPISDSQWVSPIHAVPKKAGFTVVENEKKELVQTRLPMKIRVCIDYSNWTLPLVKTTFLFHSLIKCWKDWLGMHTIVFWMDILGTTKFQLPLKIKKKSCLPVHLGRLHIIDAIWIVQCPNNVSTLHA